MCRNLDQPSASKAAETPVSFKLGTARFAQRNIDGIANVAQRQAVITQAMPPRRLDSQGVEQCLRLWMHPAEGGSDHGLVCPFLHNFPLVQMGCVLMTVLIVHGRTFVDICTTRFGACDSNVQRRQAARESC